MSDHVKCPQCLTTKYRNPSLKLLVNECGHSLCKNCVDNLFVKGSAPCPQCNVNLRKNDFRLKLFDDAFVEKEVDIRKKMLKVYNRKEEDFATLNQYNDYLEEVENIIFNLANNIDKELTLKKIELYKQENAQMIAKNQTRLSKDEELIERILYREEEEKADRMGKMELERNETEKERNRLKESLMKTMSYSNESASQILAKYAEERKRSEEKVNQKLAELDAQRARLKKREGITFSTGIRVGKGNNNVFDTGMSSMMPKHVDDGVMFEYIAPEIDINGPVFPDYEQLDSDGYLRHVRDTQEQERAGGFTNHYACYRALQESFCGLYFQAE